MSRFITHKTSIKTVIETRFNHRERTVTIKKNGSIYRSNRQSTEDFQSMQHMTGNDWLNWLKYSFDYYIVK